MEFYPPIKKGGGGVTPAGNAVATDVLAPKTFMNSSGSTLTGTIVNRSRATLGEGTVTANSVKGDGTGKLYVEPVAGYYTAGLNSAGNGSISATDTDFVPANIANGVNIFGVVGTATTGGVTPAGDATAPDVRSGKTFINNTGGTISGTNPVQATAAQTITPGTADIVKAAGIYDGAITVKGDTNLVASKIPIGTTIFGVAGTLALGKKFSSGSVTQAANLPITVTGLSFTPSLVIAIATDNSCTIIGSSRSFGTITNDNSNRYGGTFYQGVYNQSGMGDLTTNPMTANGFSITPSGQSGTKTFNWYAYE